MILPSVVLLPLTCPTLATNNSSKIQTLSQQKLIRTIFTASKVVGSETKCNKGDEGTENILPKILSKNVKLLCASETKNIFPKILLKNVKLLRTSVPIFLCVAGCTSKKRRSERIISHGIKLIYKLCPNCE